MVKTRYYALALGLMALIVGRVLIAIFRHLTE